MIKKISHVAFFILMLSLYSCKHEGCNVVLNNVSFRTTLNPQQASELNGENGSTYAEGGNCGLILFKWDSRIYAYDRCNVNGTERLMISGLMAIDPKSGAKWLLKDGSPIYNATCSLHQYAVEVHGNLVVVSN